MTLEEAYNAGLNQAKWQVTKAMLALHSEIDVKTRKLLKFICDEIDRERK